MPCYTCAYSSKALISQPNAIFAKVTKYDANALLFNKTKKTLYRKHKRTHIFKLRIFFLVDRREKS